MTSVEYAICDVQGDIFEHVANHYIYDTFVAFVPAFLHSDGIPAHKPRPGRSRAGFVWSPEDAFF